MNIVEREGIQFKDEFFGGALIINIDNLKDRLSSKLYNFNRDKDKLFFLNVLRKQVENDKLEHERKCKKTNCTISQEFETGLFLIDQEIDDINKYYEFKPTSSDQFKTEEQVELPKIRRQIFWYLPIVCYVIKTTYSRSNVSSIFRKCTKEVYLHYFFRMKLTNLHGFV